MNRLSESKPSAIYKLNGSASAANLVDADLDNQMLDEDSVEQYDINVGISIEPAAQVEATLHSQQASAASSTALVKKQTIPMPDSNSIENLANKIVSHAYNYLSGFTTADNKVSMKVFDDWWNKFKTKLATNPKFLDNLD